MTFEAWMHELDDLCFANWGLGIRDLPDMCFRDSYEDGEEPIEFFHANLGTTDDLSRAILS